MITWFQNRRAKFKRDIEEMKKDREAGAGGSGSPGDSLRLPPGPGSAPPPPGSRLPPPPVSGPSPPVPGFPPHPGLRLPVSLSSSFPSLPHPLPLPLLCLAPHLLQYPFPHPRPASSPASPKSPPSPPPMRPLAAESGPIKVEPPSV